jgi:hypothetical protein
VDNMSQRHVFVVIAAVALVTTACGGSSEAKPSPAASPTTSTAPQTSKAAGSGDAFTSRKYPYSIALPAGWSASPGTVPWDGKDLSAEGPYADLFTAPNGTMAWAAAEPTTKSLPALVAEQAAIGAKLHPCSKPESKEPISLGGDPAQLIAMHCPAKGGILVATTAVIHNGTAFFFAFQDPMTAAPAAADLAVFKSLLSKVKFS